MTVMDLFETGGELTGLRRKETAKIKKGEGNTEKRLAQQIENATEAKWKSRVMQLLKLLIITLMMFYFGCGFGL